MANDGIADTHHSLIVMNTYVSHAHDIVCKYSGIYCNDDWADDGIVDTNHSLIVVNTYVSHTIYRP
jgi:hypothetical protein